MDNFHNCKSFPLGKVYTCKVCAKLKSISWNAENKERKALAGKNITKKTKRRILNVP